MGRFYVNASNGIRRYLLVSVSISAYQDAKLSLWSDDLAKLMDDIENRFPLAKFYESPALEFLKADINSRQGARNRAREHLLQVYSALKKMSEDSTNDYLKALDLFEPPDESLIDGESEEEEKLTEQELLSVIKMRKIVSCLEWIIKDMNEVKDRLLALNIPVAISNFMVEDVANCKMIYDRILETVTLSYTDSIESDLSAAPFGEHVVN